MSSRSKGISLKDNQPQFELSPIKVPTGRKDCRDSWYMWKMSFEQFIKMAKRGYLLESPTFDPSDLDHVAQIQQPGPATVETPSNDSAAATYKADQEHWYGALLSCLDSNCPICNRARLRGDSDTTVAGLWKNLLAAFEGTGASRDTHQRSALYSIRGPNGTMDLPRFLQEVDGAVVKLRQVTDYPK